MEERKWELIEQGLKDVKQWIADAPTPESRAYREQTADRILLSKEPYMHYYRNGLDNQIIAGNWTPNVSLPHTP